MPRRLRATGIPSASKALLRHIDDLLDRRARQITERGRQPLWNRRRHRGDPARSPRLGDDRSRLWLVPADPVRGSVHPHTRPWGVSGHRTPPRRRPGRSAPPSVPVARCAGGARRACRSDRPAPPPLNGIESGGRDMRMPQDRLNLDQGQRWVAGTGRAMFQPC